ncbi:anti-sigma factor [Nocardioides sp. SYSU DS0651]|uniref:anti-sigma factor n=1 Tax=Nocardioides sp. SYSU DS0651 TaxID=3415955 RepID=UPI003F4B0198
MTDPRAPEGREDMHALSGAYAVDALDPAERERFEAHLQQCAECREEVDSLREAAATLGSDDAVEPPSSVRDAVLSGITTIRPLPPLPPQRPDPPASPASPASPEGPGAPEDAPDDPLPAAQRPDDLASRRRRRFDVRRMPLLVAAAAVVVALAGGVVWETVSDDQQAPTPTVAEQVLAADDAQRIPKRFPDGAEAVVVVSRSLGRAVIQTEEMPPAPDGKDYQLWLQTPAGEMQDAGVMPNSRDTTKLLEGDASRATGVGITVEPDGGSPQPTSEPIAFFPLEA